LWFTRLKTSILVPPQVALGACSDDFFPGRSISGEMLGKLVTFPPKCISFLLNRYASLVCGLSLLMSSICSFTFTALCLP